MNQQPVVGLILQSKVCLWSPMPVFEPLTEDELKNGCVFWRLRKIQPRIKVMLSVLNNNKQNHPPFISTCLVSSESFHMRSLFWEGPHQIASEKTETLPF